MFGISVYFQDLDLDYIRLAHSYGADAIFTSIHIPEEDFGGFDEKLHALIHLSTELKMHLVADISPYTFEKLGLEMNDYKGLRNYGFDSVRLDFGFEDFTIIKKLSDTFNLFLNASIIDEHFMTQCEVYKVNLDNTVLSHNFYPKVDSGLSVQTFIERNEQLKQYNLPVHAFVPGDLLKRFPLYEGLPTLEVHRNVDPYLATVDLDRNYGVGMYIGDSLAHEETLRRIARYLSEGIVTIPCHLHEDYHHLYDTVLRTREDISDDTIRVRDTRVMGVKQSNSKERLRGMITVDNELLGRYSGELSLIKHDLPMDARINVIGFVPDAYHKLLDYLEGRDKIQFVAIGNLF